jgi:hypothetical protein
MERGMKRVALCIAMAVASAAMPAAKPLWGQTSEIPSAAPKPVGSGTPEERGQALLKDMVNMLGGDGWLDRKNVQELGRIARFFRGAPTGAVIDFSRTVRFQDATHLEAERIGFITDKSMILPGKKIDVVQIWAGGTGYEITYRGKSSLPREQIEDFYRRQEHSIESVVRDWLKAPGVMVVDEGTSMVERRLAEKVTVLSANNDAVTIDLDATTHLPLRRTFKWRNTTFKDYDEDVEEYDGYQTIQGLPTPYTITRYRNGDMISQTFLRKAEYNVDLLPDLFTQEILVKKK